MPIRYLKRNLIPWIFNREESFKFRTVKINLPHKKIWEMTF